MFQPSEELIHVDLTKNTVEANLFKTLIFSEMATHFKNQDLSVSTPEEAQETMIRELIKNFPYKNYKFILPASQLASQMEFISDGYCKAGEEYCIFVVKHG